MKSRMNYFALFLVLGLLVSGIITENAKSAYRSSKALKTLWGAVNDDGTVEYYPTEGRHKKKHHHHNKHHQTDEEEDAIIANGGGCDLFGCFEKGGGCSLYGCFKAGGGCDINGCW